MFLHPKCNPAANTNHHSWWHWCEVFHQLTMCTSKQYSAQKITHCFIWRLDLFSILSLYPSSVMSAISVVSGCSVLMPHQAVMAFQLSLHSFLYVLKDVFFFLFLQYTLTALQLNPMNRPKALRHTQGQVSCVDTGGLLPSLRVWFHFGLSLPFGGTVGGHSLWKSASVCVKTKWLVLH